MKTALWVALIAGVVGGTGCSSYSAAVVSQQGKAFVTVSGFLNQTMYLCDASGGKPVCTEQKEEK